MEKPENCDSKGVFRRRFTVPRDAIDENGHVNNVVYVQWMQDTAVAHSDAVGGTRAAVAAGGTWVVRSHHVEYLRPAFAGDELMVETWVTDFRRVRSTRRYRFLRVKDGTELARGATDWVFVNADNGRPTAVPEAVQACFTLVDD